MREILMGIGLTIFAFTANAAVIHTYEFGNTANGGSDTGTLEFSSEGTLRTDGLIASDYGNFKTTLNGVFYDFGNLESEKDGWTLTYSSYLYEFMPQGVDVRVIVNYENGRKTKSYSALISNFDEDLGFGAGFIRLRVGTSQTSLEDYNTGVSYLHTTPAVVPIPAAAWLFSSGLLGLIAVARRDKRKLH